MKYKNRRISIWNGPVNKLPLPYFQIRGEAGAEIAEIMIYGDIGESFWSDGIGAKKFADDLKVLKDVKSLDIRINSPGGSVYEGLAIYNTLDRHPAQKTVYIDGLAASIASVIAMAGNKIIMPENAMMMIHNPFGMVVGDSEDMRKVAETLDKVKEGFITAYMKKTKMSSQDIWALMDEETWMTAAEAIGRGFADEFAKPVRMAAHFDLSKFKKVPANILGRSEQKNNPRKEEKRRNEKMENEITDVKEILAIGTEFKMEAEAIKFVQEGKTIDDFRNFIMAELRKNYNSTPSLFRPGSGGQQRPAPYKNFGDFLHSVREAGRPGGRTDEKLFSIRNAAGLSEGVSSDGGFLVQQDFSTELLQNVFETGKLASRCRRIQISTNANGIMIPGIDETSRASTRMGGIVGYWEAEAAEKTASKPKFRNMNLVLKKMIGLCYTSDELLQDATALASIVRNGFASEFGFMLDDAIINGSGAGQPLGILNSGCLVVQSKETGQITPSIMAENVIKMYSRLLPGSEKSACWLINAGCIPALYQMSIAVGLGGVPVYVPAGGLANQPYSSLFGLPVIVIEQCATLGTLGDIILADLSNGYILAEKGGLQADMSIHVRFIYDESCFRFVLRVDGQPVRATALTPYKGGSGATQSHFIALQTRS